MRLTERLAEIDRELASFGKAGDVLDDVARRARAEVPASLDAIDAQLEALGEPRQAAESPALAPPKVETVAPPGVVARPATWERPERTTPPPEDGSGLVEVPEELIRREALPPVLELDGAAHLESGADEAGSDTVPPAAPADGDAPAHADSSDALAEALFSDDEATAGEPTLENSSAGGEAPEALPLAALFDDAPASSPPQPEAGGLADLFDDPRPEPEPAAHEDLSDLLGADLQDALTEPPAPDERAHPPAAFDDEGEGDRTVLFTAEDARAIRSSLPPRDPAGAAAAESLDAELDAIVEEPLSDVLEPSDEFELMIDEDALVLDGDAAEVEVATASEPGARPRSQVPPIPPAPPSQVPPPPPPSSPPSQPPPPGLMSRILNRK